MRTVFIGITVGDRPHRSFHQSGNTSYQLIRNRIPELGRSYQLIRDFIPYFVHTFTDERVDPRLHFIRLHPDLLLFALLLRLAY